MIIASANILIVSLCGITSCLCMGSGWLSGTPSRRFCANRKWLSALLSTLISFSGSGCTLLLGRDNLEGPAADR